MFFRSRRALDVFRADPLKEQISKTAGALQQSEALSWMGIAGMMWGMTESWNPLIFMGAGAVLCWQNSFAQTLYERLAVSQSRRYVEECIITEDEAEKGQLKMVIKSPGLVRELTLKEDPERVKMKDILNVCREIHFDPEGTWDEEILRQRAMELSIVNEVNDLTKVSPAFLLHEETLFRTLISIDEQLLEKLRKDHEVIESLPKETEEKTMPRAQLDLISRRSLFTGVVFAFLGLVSLQSKKNAKWD